MVFISTNNWEDWFINEPSSMRRKALQTNLARVQIGNDENPDSGLLNKTEICLVP